MTRPRWWTRWQVVAAAVWLARYATLDGIPPFAPPVWADWFDQSRYLASAQGFAHGDLSAAAHWYPLAYPLLAAPLAWILPGDPFFLLDLALFLLTLRGFRAVAGRLGIGPALATLCFLLTTLAQTGLASAWAHPWTTTLSAALLWNAVAATLALDDDPGPRRCATVGALAAALPLVRPVDALSGATIVLVALAMLLRRRTLSWRGVAAAGTAGAALVAGYAALHLAIYGPRPTPYMIAAAGTGFIWDDLGWKAYIMLVDPRPWFPGATAMLHVLPWIVPGAAGLIATAATGPSRGRTAAGLLLLLIVPTAMLMLTYADLQPPGLWDDGNVHYFKWAMPAFGAGVLLCWRRWQQPAGRYALAVAGVALLLPLGISLTPVAVADDTPARMLRYRGDTRRDWHEAYFARAVVTDSAGRLENVRDFHQLPDAGGERAIAVRRPFMRDPRRFDPGEPAGAADPLPYARYGVRVGYLWF